MSGSGIARPMRIGTIAMEIAIAAATGCFGCHLPERALPRTEPVVHPDTKNPANATPQEHNQTTERLRKALRLRGFSCIGETGFEPATARPPAGCATRLRHSPSDELMITAPRRCGRSVPHREVAASDGRGAPVKRATGIEPALRAWKAPVQPQHFARGNGERTASRSGGHVAASSRTGSICTAPSPATRTATAAARSSPAGSWWISNPAVRSGAPSPDHASSAVAGNTSRCRAPCRRPPCRPSRRSAPGRGAAPGARRRPRVPAPRAGARPAPPGGGRRLPAVRRRRPAPPRAPRTTPHPRCAMR